MKVVESFPRQFAVEELPAYRKPGPDWQGKRVFARVDLNVDHDTDLLWKKDIRVGQAIALAAELSKAQCITILGSHHGRPGGCPMVTHSMAHLAPVLSRVFKLQVTFLPSLKAAERILKKARPGDVYLLENLRFDPGEEAADAAFAMKLAGLCDYYVNEAFATSHRQHASVTVLPTLVPSFLGPGFRAEHELAVLVAAQVKQPLVVLAGGCKVDKLELYQAASYATDVLLLGSGFASAVARKPNILKTFRNALAPIDVWVGTDHGLQIVALHDLQPEMKVVDIGPKTVELYRKHISTARSIICNGALGILASSDPRSSAPSIMRSVRAVSGLRIACGGTGVSTNGHAEFKFSGGGAFLSRLAMLMSGHAVGAKSVASLSVADLSTSRPSPLLLLDSKAAPQLLSMSGPTLSPQQAN